MVSHILKLLKQWIDTEWLLIGRKTSCFDSHYTSQKSEIWWWDMKTSKVRDVLKAGTFCFNFFSSNTKPRSCHCGVNEPERWPRLSVCGANQYHWIPCYHVRPCSMSNVNNALTKNIKKSNTLKNWAKTIKDDKNILWHIVNNLCGSMEPKPGL